MAERPCTADGCDRTVDHVRRGLCHRCYQAARKAGALEPLPPLPAPPHDCARGHAPSRTCYVGCRCRCRGCRDATSAAARDRYRAQAYGRYHGYVDAEPVREHVRALMARRPGSTRGMGWKRIAKLAGVSTGTMSKLLYGDRQRGMPPSRRVSPRTAEQLLAITADLADGATVPAAPTRRRIETLVAAGFARVELARYLTGDPTVRALQIGRTSRVLVAHERQVAELHRRWRAGEIEPRGRRSRHDRGPAPTSPLETRPFDGLRCVDCGAPPLGGGARCWPCYRTAVHASPEGPGRTVGTSTDNPGRGARRQVPTVRTTTAVAS